MFKNEHPACGCKQCRRGAASKAGKYVHAQINKKIRSLTKLQLKRSGGDDFVPIQISTPYTD